jgi:urea transporter/murein DD-endopeptidase MepM/ murein hydrolase activator NlpD
LIKKESIGNFISSTLNSYSQVFFSDNRVFAAILLVVSFFDIWAGVCGLMAITVTNVMASRMEYSRLQINKGAYGFNSLLVGLGTGLYFQPGFELFAIVFVASVLTFLISIALEGILAKYGLSFLSIPFLFGMWIVSLSSPDFGSMGISERGIYTANEMYLLGGKALLDVYYWWSDLEFIYSLKVYFLSLGAIFFQFNILSGVLIALGLLIYSRIAFTLSLVGFYAAFYFYQLIGADIYQLSYTYIGFNFILTSIALGGFFMIPGRSSFLWVLLILPVVVLVTISTNKIFMPFRLSIYSLPFNLVVLVFLYAMKMRLRRGKGLVEVMVQQNSPERNLYFYKNASLRFKELQYLPVSLPFFGEWTVSQAQDGEHTHRNEWKYAWDFVIEDQDRKQFKGSGDLVTDYHCYEKKVLSPADGIVQEITDGVEDNPVGDMNLNQNWGNSIVIKHAEYLYSQLSHLKAGSIKVSKGDAVKKGQVIAAVGNSGRSPYPHLHFQLQSTPYVGSVTLDYPIGYHIVRSGKDFILRSFEKPQLGDVVSNIQTNEVLKRALHFIPGQKFEFEHETGGKKETLLWEVKTDAYNNAYFHCARSGSYAYFYNDGNVHYFKNFIGDRKSQLFNFYLALFKVQTGFYKNLEISDEVPVNQSFGGLRLVLQDFLAPFYFFLRSHFTIRYLSMDNELSPSVIQLKSQISKSSLGTRFSTLEFDITIDRKGIQNIRLTEKGEVKAVCSRS